MCFPAENRKIWQSSKSRLRVRFLPEEKQMSDALLNLRKLEVTFKTPDGNIHAVNGVSFGLKEGEALGVVGESGCGKSVTMLSILRLIPSPPGRITACEAVFMGNDLLQMSNDEIRHIRGAQIGIVFQDPMTSLNPVLTIERQLTEPLELHLGMTRNQARSHAVHLLQMAGIPNAKERLMDHPHQFSGGMRQRVMIAMALACSPQILIADEPTTALDVTIQAQIIDLVRRLRDELGMALIWITHDLGVVAGLAQRVLVMYGGFIIEEALVHELFANPLHPYTHGLLGSLPRVDAQGHRRLVSIDGLPPVLYEKPEHCAFAPRCKYAIDRCWRENPPLREVYRGHRVACWDWESVRGEKARLHG
jgi:oligopeptide transport system ATP-binding protein